MSVMLYDFGFDTAIVETYSLGAQVLDFLLVMDIVLQFFRAYVNKKSVLVVQLARIRRNYLGTSPSLPVPTLCTRLPSMHCPLVPSKHDIYGQPCLCYLGKGQHAYSKPCALR